MQYTQEDTIAAIATAQGAGGIGVVRISGKKAYYIANKIVKKDLTPRYAHYTNFLSKDGSVIDSGLSLYFPGPNSFTGEDVVELQGHGGHVVLDLLMQEILSLGARTANPGEFSMRAYLNKKIDLSQAEAIADLINAGTSEAARAAVSSLQGSFAEQIKLLQEKIIYLRTYLEASLDFAEEEIDFLADGKVLGLTFALKESLEEILSKTKQGALLSSGATVCIAGEPNAGKSSLLNALSGQKTAIVADVPGTTRDLVKERINVGGVALNFVDTAGVRDGEIGVVEKEGIKKALNVYEISDIILLVIDISEKNKFDVDKYVDNFFQNTKCSGKVLVVLNKIDLNNQHLSYFSSSEYPVVFISAKTSTGVDNLSHEIKKLIGYQDNASGSWLARRRHVTALKKSLEHIVDGYEELKVNGLAELLAEELKLAQVELGQITGEFTTDDLLGEIFSSFCVGK